jgi:hypothetical protein
MVISLRFHVPFIVVSSKGSLFGMNDTYSTLLSYLIFEHRIMNHYDHDKLDMLINEQINWKLVIKG